MISQTYQEWASRLGVDPAMVEYAINSSVRHESIDRELYFTWMTNNAQAFASLGKSQVVKAMLAFEMATYIGALSPVDEVKILDPVSQAKNVSLFWWGLMEGWQGTMGWEEGDDVNVMGVMMGQELGQLFPLSG